MRRRALFLSAACLFAAVIAGCAPRGRSSDTMERSRYLMGTLCNVMVLGSDTTATGAAAARALDEIARLESVMSSWRNDSELAALNLAAGREHDCSPDLLSVLDSSLAYAEATDGTFDPTVEPLARAWDLRGPGRVPSPSELSQARAQVGWKRLRLDRARRVALLEPGAGVDLGGIGKGYALDRAAETLRADSVANALLDFGGELLALGSESKSEDPRKQGWEVPIASPLNRLKAIVAVTVRDRAVSTSAQWERGFEIAGNWFGHVLDPRTGQPVESRASVTVVASSATRADALSTALFVAGRESASEWAKRHPEDAVIWLEPAGKAVRMWSWNIEPRSLPGSRVTRMNAIHSGRDSPP